MFGIQKQIWDKEGSPMRNSVQIHYGNSFNKPKPLRSDNEVSISHSEMCDHWRKFEQFL